MSKREKAPGRIAIDWLKEQYLGGTRYEGGAAIRDAIAAAHAGKLAKCTIAAAVAWDRQARYELADAFRVVTQPVAMTSYRRNPSATPNERRATQDKRLRHAETVIHNQLRYANAIAAQFDATALEIRQAAQLAIAERIVHEVVAGS